MKVKLAVSDRSNSLNRYHNGYNDMLKSSNESNTETPVAAAADAEER